MDTFIKHLKIYDELDAEKDNLIKIMESSNMQLGTGSRIWECSVILSKYLIKQNLNNKIKIKGANILELGAGTGYLSIVMASLGGNVFSTDIKEIIPIIEKNIEINQEILQIGKGSLLPLILNWSLEIEEIKSIFQKNSIEKIDYILCSDVIFNEGQLDLFINCLKNVCNILKITGSKPTILLSYNSRNDGIDEKIADYFERNDFLGEKIDEQEMDENFKSKRIDIFELNYVK